MITVDDFEYMEKLYNEDLGLNLERGVPGFSCYVLLVTVEVLVQVPT